MEPIRAGWSSPKDQITPPRSGDNGWYLFLGRNLHDDLDLPDFEALMAQAAKQGTTQ
jgi:hypothetical protein